MTDLDALVSANTAFEGKPEGMECTGDIPQPVAPDLNINIGKRQAPNQMIVMPKEK